MVNLSKRMEAIVNMVDEGARVCDVGCDHGFVSIALLERKVALHAVMMDVNKGPLDHARDNASVYGVSSDSEFILSDGLQKYNSGHADTMIVAGMGGPLIRKILLEGSDKLSDFHTFVFSPQSEIREFRIFLYENGFEIIDEDMVLEDGKFYQIMKAVRSGENKVMLTNAEAEFGPVLLRKRHDVLKEYLLKEKEKNGILLCKLSSLPESDDIIKRMDEIKEQSQLVENALSCEGQE